MDNNQLRSLWYY